MRLVPVILGLLLLLTSISGAPPLPQIPAPPPILKLDDPRLASLSTARAHWKEQTVRHRSVGDLVVLVSNVDTFLVAMSYWTPDLFFPILIEEPETTLRFIRAFQPAQIIRLPGAGPEAPSRWRGAQKALAAASYNLPPSLLLGNVLQDARATLRSDGLVLTSPDSPSFPGAIALAAGRFQSVARFTSKIAAEEILTQDEAYSLATQVGQAVNLLYSHFDTLGDELDFLTIALPWPDRYLGTENGRKTPFALDDLIGRVGSSANRYAFVGRLSNSEPDSVYQAMCSLFLQPQKALLFNSYDTKIPPWSEYEMSSAAASLNPFCQTELFEGPDQGSRADWLHAAKRFSAHDLVMVNTSGSPTSFNLQEGNKATTQDIPWSVPAAVFFIHSFSAARPWDDSTLAGRWLTNGAFLYFGALEEPYLQSFRTPRILTELLAEGVPVAAAVHKVIGEDSFGQPWRLHLIGDPMYRLEPASIRERPRIHEGIRLPDGSVPVAASAASHETANSSSRMQTCWDTTLSQTASQPGQDPGLPQQLAAIAATNLNSTEQARYQTLLAELVVESQESTWKPLVDAIPDPQRTGTLKRALEVRATYGDLK